MSDDLCIVVEWPDHHVTQYVRTAEDAKRVVGMAAAFSVLDTAFREAMEGIRGLKVALDKIDARRRRRLPRGLRKWKRRQKAAGLWREAAR